MKTITMTAVLAALAIALAATLSNGSISRALAGPEELSQTVMPIEQLTAEAKHLPVQSFDAF